MLRDRLNCSCRSLVSKETLLCNNGAGVAFDELAEPDAVELSPEAEATAVELTREGLSVRISPLLAFLCNLSADDDV